MDLPVLRGRWERKDTVRTYNFLDGFDNIDMGPLFEMRRNRLTIGLTREEQGGKKYIVKENWPSGKRSCSGFQPWGHGVTERSEELVRPWMRQLTPGRDLRAALTNGYPSFGQTGEAYTNKAKLQYH